MTWMCAIEVTPWPGVKLHGVFAVAFGGWGLGGLPLLRLRDDDEAHEGGWNLLDLARCGTRSRALLFSV